MSERLEFCRACRDERDEIVPAEFIMGKQVPPGFWGEPDEPDDDLVEQLAQGWRTHEAAAVLAAEKGYTLEPWERCSESTQNWYRRQIGFVLAALRGGSGGSSAVVSEGEQR